ncbi:histidine N-acetyltransferase-like [Haliotis rufescens]|uniref:histidine N-acetyltransferase-like n=1 Tax=Haliotis rufescens TaxID=6454 RepID=UPI00201F7608|nr:histidine N-acetyltransferase-like [Haliotis rufescens]XP_048244780.1 histidine N-acetyltransferase-like [Haliotis rufescens]
MGAHSIRRATHDDFDELMQIGDVYQGMDYLGHRYHTYIDDPNNRSYVYVIADEIIALCSAFIIDDGQTFMIRGARTKEGFRGQGFYGKLNKYVYAQYGKIPSIKYDVMTTGNHNYDANKDRLLRKHTELNRKSLVHGRFKMSDTHVRELEGPYPVLQEMTSSDLLDLFGSEGSRKSLFPVNKIVIDWIPLRFLPSNMKYILEPEALCLRSKGNNGETTLLTFGTPSNCELGLRYSMDIFGDDFADFPYHVKRHMSHVATLTQGYVFLQMVIEERFRENAVNVLPLLNLPPFEFSWTTQINFETTFKVIK